MSNANSFHAALRILLKPLARYCLAHAIRLQEFLEVCKQVMVEAAEENSRRDGVEATMARISVMTGVHRKDVARLMSGTPSLTPSTGSLAARVLGQWQGDRRFCDKRGRPKVLSLSEPATGFGALVHAVSRELNPSLVLSELERTGAVRQQGDSVKLVNAVFSLSGDVAEGLSLLAEDVDDLMSSVEQNLLANEETKNLHIKTEFDAVPDALLPEVKEHMLREGTRFHKEMSAYLSAWDKDVNGALKEMAGRNRVVLGSFSYASPSDKSSRSKNV